MSSSTSRVPEVGSKDWFDLLEEANILGLKRIEFDDGRNSGLSYEERKSLVVTSENRQDTLSLFLDKGVRHLVQSDGLTFSEELNSSANLLKDESLFFDFPISSILDSKNAGIGREGELVLFERRFSNDSEKIDLQLGLEQALSGHVRSRSLLTEIVGVSDELITNVIYNAPHVTSDNATSGIRRTSKGVKLNKGKTGRLVCGMDESRVVVGCEDPYGALNLRAMLERVQRCYRTGVADSMSIGPGGARIGMFLMMNSSTSFYAGVIPGEMTSVYCVFPYKLSNKKRSIEPLNLHVFSSSREQK